MTNELKRKNKSITSPSTTILYTMHISPPIELIAWTQKQGGFQPSNSKMIEKTPRTIHCIKQTIRTTTIPTPPNCHTQPNIRNLQNIPPPHPPPQTNNPGQETQTMIEQHCIYSKTWLMRSQENHFTSNRTQPKKKITKGSLTHKTSHHSTAL